MPTPETESPTVEAVSAAQLPSAAGDLGVLLKACVEDGAGIGFVLPLSRARADAFWLGYGPLLADGACHLFVVRQARQIVGTVTLALARQDNGGHRAEIAKLMVHPGARRQGYACQLLEHAETHARTLGRSLLVLDTVTGDTAEGLYARLGYARVGVIPRYARGAAGGFDDTTIFYKHLD